MLIALETQNQITASLDLGLSLVRGAFSVEDLFCGIGFPLCSELLTTLRDFKTSLYGKACYFQI